MILLDYPNNKQGTLGYIKLMADGDGGGASYNTNYKFVISNLEWYTHLDL